MEKDTRYVRYPLLSVSDPLLLHATGPFGSYTCCPAGLSSTHKIWDLVFVVHKPVKNMVSLSVKLCRVQSLCRLQLQSVYTDPALATYAWSTRPACLLVSPHLLPFLQSSLLRWAIYSCISLTLRPTSFLFLYTDVMYETIPILKSLLLCMVQSLH